MDNFTKSVLKYSNDNGLGLVFEEVDPNAQQDPNAQGQQPADAQTQTQPQNQNQQPEPPANEEENPFPERFVYLAGLLQKALLDKFPSLMNIESINQDNVAQVIQNMEGLMKQAGMLDGIDTNEQSL